MEASREPWLAKAAMHLERALILAEAEMRRLHQQEHPSSQGVRVVGSDGSNAAAGSSARPDTVQQQQEEAAKAADTTVRVRIVNMISRATAS